MPTDPPPTFPTVQRLIAAARTTERNALQQRLRDPALVEVVAKAIDQALLGSETQSVKMRSRREAARAALAVIEEALQ